MNVYARSSRLLVAQVLADAAMLAWIAACWWCGRLADSFLRGLAQPAVDAGRAATQVKGQLTDAADQVKDLPLVGDQLRAPFDQVSGSVDGLVQAADAQVVAINQAATATGWAVFLAPVLLALAFWLPWRVAQVRAARQLKSLSSSPAGDELLALRALATQPLAALMNVTSDPVAVWRSGDPEAMRRLADVALHAGGVSRPRRLHDGATGSLRRPR